MTPNDAYWAFAQAGTLPVSLPIEANGEHGLITANVLPHAHIAARLMSDDVDLRVRTIIGATMETRCVIQQNNPGIKVT